ncbi:MAG: helix-turn-helix transcriptional regulator [Butyrivibrio sp.]|nr:helix-turn-helix transcriptional regulator [Butyrivibrio sp.]
MESSLGNKKIFSTNLQKIMKEKNKTPADIYKALNVAPTTFSDWYHGKVYPRIDKIEMIANYLQISKSDLVEEHKEDIDLGLRRIERARTNMSDEEKEKMMKLLELSFEKYFI